MRIPKLGGGEEVMVLGLWYHDRYRRTAQGWRIVERVEKRGFDLGMPEWMKKVLKLG
jgi:hypothetical protein